MSYMRWYMAYLTYINKIPMTLSRGLKYVLANWTKSLPKRRTPFSYHLLSTGQSTGVTPSANISVISTPTSGLEVVDSATGEVVWGNKRRGIGPDRRPKTEHLVTLKPRTPVCQVDWHRNLGGCWQTGSIKLVCNRGAVGGGIGRFKRGKARMKECLRNYVDASYHHQCLSHGMR